LWPTGRRFGAGAGFFGAFLGAGAGLRLFFTGAILWKLIVLSFVSYVFLSFALFAFDMENTTGLLTQEKRFSLRPS
jgi:hypothetical protein